jgi:hypothetical protein
MLDRTTVLSTIFDLVPGQFEPMSGSSFITVRTCIMDSWQSSNVRRAREQLEIAYNQRDMEGVLSYYDKNPTFTDHALDQTYTTIEGIQSYVAEQWAPSSSDEIRVIEALEAGDWTIARFVTTGVNDRPYGALAPSNRPFEVEFCALTRWRDGKIVEDHLYYDLYGILVQLGHAEPFAAPLQAG